jgi:hypothetical protein
VSQSQRNVVFGAIAVVALAVAAYLFISNSGGQAEIASELRTYGRCLACSYESFIDYNRNQIPPFPCPDCSETAVYSLYYCYDCHKRFVPNLEKIDADGPPRPPVPPLVVLCPQCRGDTVMAFIPDKMGEEPQGDLPWPDWR